MKKSDKSALQRLEDRLSDSKTKSYMVTMNIRISKTRYLQLQKLAQKKELRVSPFARAVLIEYLDKRLQIDNKI